MLRTRQRLSPSFLPVAEGELLAAEDELWVEGELPTAVLTSDFDKSDVL